MNGDLQPVFFGSALNNFGVRELLDAFIEIAPNPQPKESDTRLVKPEEKDFTGFIFKIHANMDPKHRDRLAFVRNRPINGRRSSAIVYFGYEQSKNYRNGWSASIRGDSISFGA